MNKSISRKQSHVLVVLIAALGIVVRLIKLGSMSFSYDEWYSSTISAKSLAVVSTRFCQTPTLYHIFLHFWLKLGSNDVIIRLLSVLFGVITIWVIYLLGKKMLDVKHGLICAFLLAISPFHIWYSTEAKNNAMVIFFTVLIFVSYANLLENGRWKWVIVATIAGVLGIFTDFLLMLPLASVLIMSIVDLMKNFSGDRLKRFLVAFILTAFLASPLLIFKLFHTDEMFRAYMKPLNLEELYLLLFNFFSNGNNILRIHVYRGGFRFLGQSPSVDCCGRNLRCVGYALRSLCMHRKYALGGPFFGPGGLLGPWAGRARQG